MNSELVIPQPKVFLEHMILKEYKKHMIRVVCNLQSYENSKCKKTSICAFRMQYRKNTRIIRNRREGKFL